MRKTIIINVIGNVGTRTPTIEITTDKGDFTKSYLQNLFYTLYITFRDNEEKIEEIEHEKIQ